MKPLFKCFFTVFTIVWAALACGQQQPPAVDTATTLDEPGFPTDWSRQQVVFSSLGADLDGLQGDLGRAPTSSSPFVDYRHETAYVSDNFGNVYAISPVFGGGPPAVKTGWPVSIGASKTLTAPVYDSVSKRVFVAAANGNLYYIQTTGTCGGTPAPCLGGSTAVSAIGTTITAPPVVDATTSLCFLKALRPDLV